MYIESVDIGLNHEGTTFFDKLGIAYISNGSDQEIIKLKGDPGSLTSGLVYNMLGGYDPHYSVDRIDANGSEMLFCSEDGYGRTFIKEDEGYRAISSSVILASVASGDSLNLRAFLVAEMVNAFLGYNPSTSLEEDFSHVLGGSNYPNPFSGSTTIEYTISETGRVTIEVYDLSGKVVKQLVNDDFLPGSYSITWDATNNNGTLVENGFYFFRVSQGNQSVTAKMVLLR